MHLLSGKTSWAAVKSRNTISGRSSVQHRPEPNSEYCAEHLRHLARYRESLPRIGCTSGYGIPKFLVNEKWRASPTEAHPGPSHRCELIKGQDEPAIDVSDPVAETSEA